VTLLTLGLSLTALITVLNVMMTLRLAARLREGRSEHQYWNNPGGLAVGQPIPRFDDVTTAGDELNNATLETGQVVIAFMSSSCDGCHAALPEFLALANRSETRTVAVVHDDGDDGGALVGELECAMPVVLDTAANRLSQTWKIQVLPTFISVLQGKVVDYAPSLKALRL
jgi:hypothetical protein